MKLAVKPVIESTKKVEEPSAVLGYVYDKGTGVWRTITLKDFDDEMGELLRVFSTWEEDTKASSLI